MEKRNHVDSIHHKTTASKHFMVESITIREFPVLIVILRKDMEINLEAKEYWVMHGLTSHSSYDCDDCEDCCKTLEAFQEFKKTDEYQKLING